MKNQITPDLRIPRLPLCFCALVALLFVVLLPAPARAAKGVTDPDTIKNLASDAFVWGYGPQFVYRFSLYNTILGPPFNEFKYGSVPAAWNNNATDAGDGSVLYVNGFVNLATNDLVFTVPPSINQYYVAAYYDAYANTVGSIGTRTTPADAVISYLLVGPKSPHARKKTARIHGYEYPVMASDTDINWFIIRVLANTLNDATNPTSVPSVLANVVQKFALNTRQDFERNGNQPIYPTSFFIPPPNSNQVSQAEQFQNTTTNAVTFFEQLGTALVINPIPSRVTGLSGTTVSNLPAYVVPQYSAKRSDTYLVPSYGQQHTLDAFTPIGLTSQGFHIPNNWGPTQLQALQDGFELGQSNLAQFISGASTSTNTVWAIVNDIVGTYPNTPVGYLYKSLIVVEGGVANVPLDGVYPNLTAIPCPPDTTNFCALDGNNTYTLTFMPRSSTNLPARGIYPPMVTDDNGNPKGFWSVTVYATDPTEGSAPFIPQTSVLNTSYSSPDTPVVSVDAAANSITVKPPAWGTLVASTPILFGTNAAAYGLTSGGVYYVADTPTTNTDGTFTIHISTSWLQTISQGGVPIQDTGSAGQPFVTLLSPPVPPTLTYGPVQPVCQLGSAQIADGQLATNANGSLTLWFGPMLPPGAPASNWLPTPSSSYYQPLYPTNTVSTAFEALIRMYYPTPGDQPPSILLCPDPPLHESYVPPLLELMQ